MKPVQKLLFGKFPRRFGNPVQWPVHSESEMDVAIDECEGERNLYSTISYFDLTEGGGVISDKIAFDLDSPFKDAAFPDLDRDDEKIHAMRQDRDLAEEVLGEVVSDARLVAEYAQSQEIPLVGVFSGFGIHLHLLYQDQLNASRHLATTVRKVIDEYDLETADVQIIGDVQRILRIPNVRRVYVDADRGESITSDTHTMPCNLYTVPLTRREIRNLTVDELLDWSTSTRDIPIPGENERPQMKVYDEYLEERATARGKVETEIDVEEYDRQGLLNMLKDLLQMPCMYERIVQPNPHHMVRFNSAVLLFNAGFSREEIETIFMKLGWRDADRRKTRKFLKQIERRGYSDMSCRTIQGLGLCQREDDPESCETYGWSGGEAEWMS
ncbi:DNA primase [Haloarcula virus HCTV-16]|nr:DNA primase [Haloarcula virus HCTV-16]